MAQIKFLAEQGIETGIKKESFELGKGVSWSEVKPTCMITEPDINRLCVEMMIWAQYTKAVRVTTLLWDFEILPGTFKKWCVRFPVLQETYDLVKLYFAEKREKAAGNGDLNPSLVAATLDNYCPDYAALRKEMKAQMASNLQGAASIKVYMDKSPETDIVPEKCLGGTEGD